MGKQETVFILIFGTIMFTLLVSFLFFVLIWYRRKRNISIFEHEKMQALYKQELLATRLEIQEETFKTISQEIHDNIGQALSFVKLNINTVDVYNPEAAKEKLLESKTQLSQTIQDLRDLAKSLNPDFLTEIGLAGAVEQQLQLMQKTSLYKTTLTVNGSEYQNQLQQELVIFRIIQELLNNIVKHADASVVEVQMHYETGSLTITVIDNGKGFDTIGKSNSGKGLGLPNMLNRMNLINGKIIIDSVPGQGTTAIITLPRQTIMEAVNTSIF